jgi:hypothetical protein
VDEHPELGVAVPLARREAFGGDRVSPLREHDDGYEGVEDSFKLNCPGNMVKPDGVYSDVCC